MAEYFASPYCYKEFYVKSIKTIISFIVVAISMVILAPIGFVFGLLGFVFLKKAMHFITYKVAQGWAVFIIWFIGCKLNVKGKGNVPKTGPLCFVCNHDSIFDILIILAIMGRPAGFIAKKELAMIPVLNIWIFLLGGHFIDRKDIRKAIKTINKGVEHIKQGGAMIIFPEGTRSRGHGLLPFRSGAFKLATQSGAQISPIAISGSYEVFERDYRVHSIKLDVTIAPPINITELSAEERRKDLSNKVHTIISNALCTHNSPEKQE